MPGSSRIAEGDSLAALDLGSNSFHLIVARYERGELRIIDRLRDPVRMAMGLTPEGTLEPERHRRALRCLARFGERLRELPSERVRAVATNSVRRLRNPRAFLLTAETALGHPIEVVAGREEARLIYLGVAHSLPPSRHTRLVIDVGGGSTEFIIGLGLTAQATESLQMGCVASTLRFCPDGRVTRKRWQAAQTEIEIELQQFAADYRARGWHEAFGASGTARSLGAISAALGETEGFITPASMAEIQERLIDAGEIDKFKLPGLSEDRRAIVAGGAVIMQSVLKALSIDRLRVCEYAMREGLLYDMLGRAEHRDPREASINGLAARYGVDTDQARRVEQTALTLFDQVSVDWELDENHRAWLSWCARVHEAGLAIAHSQHHVHGAYVLRYSDLFGFSDQEQQVLAFIVRAHRRAIPLDELNHLPGRLAEPAWRVAVLLRLAALLHRGRAPLDLPEMRAKASDKSLRLFIAETWLAGHPLAQVDLDQERKHLAELNLKLVIGSA